MSEWLKRVHKKNFKFTVLIDFVFYVSVTFVLLKVHHVFRISRTSPFTPAFVHRKFTGCVHFFMSWSCYDQEMNQEVAMKLTVVNRGSIEENAVVELFESDRKDLQTRFEH